MIEHKCKYCGFGGELFHSTVANVSAHPECIQNRHNNYPDDEVVAMIYDECIGVLQKRIETQKRTNEHLAMFSLQTMLAQYAMSLRAINGYINFYDLDYDSIWDAANQVHDQMVREDMDEQREEI